MKTIVVNPVPESNQNNKLDTEEIAQLTPFSKKDLEGMQFARGSMLGGSNPLESPNQAPWETSK